MRTVPTVFVVDDDPAVRKSLTRLGESLSLPVEAYASATEFLDAYDPQRPGCVVLDMRMPGMSGLELQDRLQVERIDIPVIVVTAYGDVPSAVRAMKKGAVDFIEKPIRPQSLLERINEALSRDRRTREQTAERRSFQERLEILSPRERQVLDLLVVGRSAKEIGVELGISHKTIQVHRARILEKLQVGSIAELVRRVLCTRQCEGKSYSPKA
jgi:RNA polymerase sigma factor (sigma-70 family)